MFFELSALWIVLIAIGLAKLYSQYQQFTYWKRNGVPYVKSTIMYIQAWKVLLGFDAFHEYCLSLYKFNPKVRYIGTMESSINTIVLRDPELIKQVTVKFFEHFPDHRSFVTEEMDPIFGKNVFSLKGDRWREMRNTLSPSFTASKMKFMFGLVSKCCEGFVDYLHDHPELSSSLEAKDAFTRYTNDVIATVAFGIDVNSLKHRNNEFYLRGVDATKFSGVFRLLKFVAFHLFPRAMRMAGFKFLSRSTTAFFCKTITETIQTRDRQGIIRPDMIHLLMQARDEGKEITEDDIVAQAFIFFLAGFETVSILMCFAIYTLALHPDVQERLREEVDQRLKEDGQISYESLLKMKYMDMVISETLRLYPPVLMIDRVCEKEFDLPPAGDGYKSVTVRQNNNVMIPVYGLHTDPQYFPDPEKFDPERFNDENKDSINPYVYIPFGMGPRQCIGNRFALMETKILIANILRKFVVKPHEKTTIPIVFKNASFSLIPKDGFWVRLEKREG